MRSPGVAAGSIGLSSWPHSGGGGAPAGMGEATRQLRVLPGSRPCVVGARVGVGVGVGVGVRVKVRVGVGVWAWVWVWAGVGVGVRVGVRVGVGVSVGVRVRVGFGFGLRGVGQRRAQLGGGGLVRIGVRIRIGARVRVRDGVGVRVRFGVWGRVTVRLSLAASPGRCRWTRALDP